MQRIPLHARLNDSCLGGLTAQGTALFWLLADGLHQTFDFPLGLLVVPQAADTFSGYQSAPHVHTTVALESNLCHVFSFLDYLH